MNQGMVNPAAIKKVFNEATEARIRLTTYKNAEITSKHIMKVCTICDRFIGPDNESFISIDDLKHKYLSYFHEDLIENIYDIDFSVIKTLNKYYTQKHFNAEEDEWLKKLILSPRSYGSNPKNKKQK